MSFSFQKVVGVESDNSSLIGLRDIGEDAVNHSDEHSVLVRVTGVLDDWHNVGSRFGDVEQITAGSVRELDGVDETFGSDDVRNVRNCSSRSSTKIENLNIKLTFKPKNPFILVCLERCGFYQHHREWQQQA